MRSEQVKEELARGRYGERLARIYGCTERGAQTCARRLAETVERFEKLYGAGRDVAVFSAPGRTEVCGNHTDHQGGRVLAAGVDLDAVAVAARTEDGRVRVKSEGFPADEIEAGDLEKKPGEENTSKALIRGICAGFARRGRRPGGFCAYTRSQVLPGSGLSSSAAFEVLVGSVVNGLFCGGEVPPLAVAQIGRYAENEYFGKPCGLMDQAASAVGGFALLDFFEEGNPKAEKIPFDFSRCGYRMCMIDTKGSHAGLTPDYAAIPREMRRVAACFGKTVLSQVEERGFYAHLKEVRAAAGDRAVLRAIHFFGDNARVLKEAGALKKGDFGAFLRLVVESGRSSFMYLQNVYSPSRVSEQGVAVALALCERLLAPRGGAWRVHGGGFAGTVQAYVPEDFLGRFTREIESVFGENTCRPLAVRPAGGVRIL
ncbi:MAG TPA: galactokinase [Ruminococcaceae bacterium]|jgi:galactokinase|nr:galactokinase [Oscillospiraceae bacterium]HBG55941.1 galactokinase [Oscillospiraceae bacterium]HBQ46563.1 galactokinase [Oscillospiraceae bacterium]HCB92023.1 galactokinase [Oscillospiraceae bacterium]